MWEINLKACELVILDWIKLIGGTWIWTQARERAIAQVQRAVLSGRLKSLYCEKEQQQNKRPSTHFRWPNNCGTYYRKKVKTFAGHCIFFVICFIAVCIAMFWFKLCCCFCFALGTFSDFLNNAVTVFGRHTDIPRLFVVFNQKRCQYTANQLYWQKACRHRADKQSHRENHATHITRSLTHSPCRRSAMVRKS